MLAVENSIELRASPERVWRALTALDDYARWHPFVDARGEPTPGAEVDYVFRNTILRRSITAAATIMRNEEPTAFAWRLGIGFLLSFDEMFEMQPCERGTMLRHRMVARGLLKHLRPRFIERGLRDFVVRIDDALDRHLRGAAPAMPGNRRKRRVAQSRARQAALPRQPGNDR